VSVTDLGLRSNRSAASVLGGIIEDNVSIAACLLGSGGSIGLGHGKFISLSEPIWLTTIRCSVRKTHVFRTLWDEYAINTSTNPAKRVRSSAHSGQQPAPGKSQVISLTDPAAAELLHRIRKNQFNLGKLPKHAQTAPVIWNAVLAA
jgi:hypothetical protein